MGFLYKIFISSQFYFSTQMYIISLWQTEYYQQRTQLCCSAVYWYCSVHVKLSEGQCAKCATVNVALSFFSKDVETVETVIYIKILTTFFFKYCCPTKRLWIVGVNVCVQPLYWNWKILKFCRILWRQNGFFWICK